MSILNAAILAKVTKIEAAVSGGSGNGGESGGESGKPTITIIGLYTGTTKTYEITEGMIWLELIKSEQNADGRLSDSSSGNIEFDCGEDEYGDYVYQLVHMPGRSNVDGGHEIIAGTIYVAV